MKLLRIALMMLRYRAALMLWLFLLLGIAYHQALTRLRWSYLWAILALAGSYVAATTLNDIADQHIDRINHPCSKERPLVTGRATEDDLWVVHLAAVAYTLAFAALISPTALGIAGLGTIINYAYSAAPVRLSHRTYGAPLALAVAYVFLPYWLGVEAAGSSLAGPDAVFVGALLSLFVGRINLKDFRDQAGDARYGKPTLLLRYGKRVTCAVSLVAVLLGNGLLVAALSSRLPISTGLLELYFVAIFALYLRLWTATDPEQELMAIGTGAKMGNGLLVTVLGSLVLVAYHAPVGHQLAFVSTTVAVYAVSFAMLITSPPSALYDYRG